MSGHWHIYVAALLVVAGVSTSPASSNPLTDLFDFTPKEAAAPAPVQEACVLQPGKSTAPGQHWVYRIDGHRKCWFQADEATVSVKKQIRRHAAKEPAAAREENEDAPRKKEVLDARAQLLNAASAGAPQSTPPTPQMTETASVPAQETATVVPAAPVAAQPTIDEPPPDQAAPRSVDVEMLLAASTLDEDTATSAAPSATSGAPPVAGADDWGSMVARAGTTLIVLGLVFLVGSLLAGQFLGPRAVPIHRRER
jgi:hypothetical protein